MSRRSTIVVFGPTSRIRFESGALHWKTLTRTAARRNGVAGGGRPSEGLRECRIGERGERLGDLGLTDLVVADQQPLEQRLVPLAAQMAGRGEVGALAIDHEVKRLAKRVLDVGKGGLGDFDVVFGLFALLGQPVLLGAQ